MNALDYLHVVTPFANGLDYFQLVSDCLAPGVGNLAVGYGDDELYATSDGEDLFVYKAVGKGNEVAT